MGKSNNFLFFCNTGGFTDAERPTGTDIQVSFGLTETMAFSYYTLKNVVYYAQQKRKNNWVI